VEEGFENDETCFIEPARRSLKKTFIRFTSVRYTARPILAPSIQPVRSGRHYHVDVLMTQSPIERTAGSEIGRILGEPSEAMPRGKAHGKLFAIE
jgi:hypothetical protein